MFQRRLLLLPLVALSAVSASMDSLLWNHVGYERTGPKTAVVKNSGGGVSTSGFQLLDLSGKSVFQGTASTSSQVPGWGTSTWKVLDFSSFVDSGSFRLKILPTGLVSDTFSIGDELLLRATGPAVVSFFHSMQSKDDGDRKISYYGQPARGTHDVYGGWMDATGDDGKYISHLSYANFMNPQQIPMVVWSLLRANLLAPKAVAHWKSGLLAEAAWGADYLVRIQDTQGYFYINVFRSHWITDTAKAICAWVGDSLTQGIPTADYQAAWREGGGMSIAALALAARSGISGTYSSAQYLAAAVRGFDHLSSKKGRWDDDGRENLIDHYCALLAAVELAQATGIQRFADSAAVRADSIVARQQDAGWLLSDNGSRPFYHGVDEGLPLVALWAYLEIDPSSPRADAVRAALTKSVQWYGSLTRGVPNPFLYPRMYAPDSPSGGPSGSGNVALGKTAWASETESGNPASNAVDGKDDQGHRWSAYHSGITTALDGYKAWIAVDLGMTYTLTQTTLSWEAAFATQFEIQVADDTTHWKTVVAATSATGGHQTYSFPDLTSARYLRIYCDKRSLPYGGYSILEWTLVGTPIASTAPVVSASARFFMPHDNESGYWWQGENARLGSMSTALLLAGRAIKPGWTLATSDPLSQEGVAGLDWVLGKNAVGVNFLYGVNGGCTSPYNGGTNQKGGIANGITAVSDADQSPLFLDNAGTSNLPYFYWRWTEQWLPHDAWYLLGIACVAHLVEFPPGVGIERVYRPGPGMSIVCAAGRIRASLSAPANWTLLGPSGRIHSRRSGSASVEFSPGRGTWILEATDADGIRQSRIVALP